MFPAEAAALLDALPIAVLALDADDQILFANTAGGSLFRDRGHLIGSPIGDLISRRPIAGQDACSFILEADGRLRPFRVREAGRFPAVGTGRMLLIEPDGEGLFADAAVLEENHRLRSVIEMLPQALCIFDSEDRYVFWNKSYADLYPDIAPHLVPGMPFEGILKLSLSGGDMQEQVENQAAWLEERMRKFRQPLNRDEQQLRDGRWLRHDDQRTPDGGAIGMRVDITELKQREEWLRQLFDANPMPMLLCDSESLVILEANAAAVDFYGYERDVLHSKRATDLHVDGEATLFGQRLRSLESDCDARTVWRQRAAGGGLHHVLIYVRLLKKGIARQLLLTITDISDRIRAESEATRLANHDALTGLPNRMHFYRVVDEALGGDDRDALVVLCLDLDGFKPVNDTFGHAAGDEVLKAAAERLRVAASPQTVARFGGDEFAIVMMGDQEAACAVAEACVAAFRTPFAIKGLPIRLGVSVGIGRACVSGVGRESLLQAADHALYRAKAEGKNAWRMENERHAPDRRSTG